MLSQQQKGPARRPASSAVDRQATVDQGLGIALLPSFIVSEALSAKTLRIVDIGLDADEEHIYIAHPDGRNPSAKLRALAAWLKDAFGSPPYWDTSAA